MQMEYSSWITVSDFLLMVEADDEEEAREKLKELLNNIEVRVFERDEEPFELGCSITDVDAA